MNKDFNLGFVVEPIIFFVLIGWHAGVHKRYSTRDGFDWLLVSLTTE